MKIAVDVLGTLNGRKNTFIMAMIRLLYDAGHSITVWSSEYSLAQNAAMGLRARGIQCDAMSKKCAFDTEEEHFFDYAFEDDRLQSYLATKKFIWVDEIPESLADCRTLARNMK